MKLVKSGWWPVAGGRLPAAGRWLLILGVWATACGSRLTLTPSPAPTLTRSPAPTLAPTFVTEQSVTPSVAPSAQSVELTICLADEPQSLYLYARPEAGRAHILAALYDGPLDEVNGVYQPVLLEKLPSLNDGEVVVKNVVLNAGDTVVDEIGRVVTLVEGVTVNLLEGEPITYSGAGPITVPQMGVTFKLKPGVWWSDGTPLTAHDSVFSYDVSLSPDSFDPRRALAERTSAYRALDDVTVEWVGRPGYIDPDYASNFWTPLPRHRYAGLTPSEIADSDEARFNPLGWGPFILKEWVWGDHLTFERNPFYFRASEGLPRADTVTYRVVSDPAQIVADLRSGQCALAPHSAALESVQESLMQLQLGQTVPGAALTYLYFGLQPATDYARAVGNDFFADGRARQAIAHCLTWLSPTPPNPALGRALLAQLGWEDSDGDGLLDKVGIPLRLTLVGYGSRPPLAALDAQLQTSCGIDVEPRPLTRGELMNDWPDGVVFGRRFDLAVLTWEVGNVPPCELWLTAQIPDDSNPGGANAAGYSNPDYDDACRHALTALHPVVVAGHLAEAQYWLDQDMPVLPLFYSIRVAAALPGVQGFTLDSTSASELWNIEALTVTP